MGVSSPPPSHAGRAKPPIHLWGVGLLLALWNSWGVAVAIGVQTNRAALMDPADAAFFEAQPLWLVLVADLGALAGVAGAVSLLLQSRWALRFFVAQLAVLTLTNSYEVAIGTSLLLTSRELGATTAVLVVLLGGQILYAWWMARRQVLY